MPTTTDGMAQHLELSVPQQTSLITPGPFSTPSASGVAPLTLGASSSLMLNAWSARPFGLQPSAINISTTSKAINPNIKGFHQCHNAFRFISRRLMRHVELEYFALIIFSSHR